jgi:D-sedoheptulose 7-phosphate isomerase
MLFSIHEFVIEEIRSSVETKNKLLLDLVLLEEVVRVTEACVLAFSGGRKVLFIGNGGSAADAQHLAAEFVSRFYFDRPGLPSMALSTDPSIVTAIGNDYGYEKLFSRQIEAHGQSGDILVAISTSGKSSNVINGIRTARERGLKTVAMTSAKGHDMAEICDYRIMVPSSVTPKVQECHITIGHAICAGVEAALFAKKS